LGAKAIHPTGVTNVIAVLANVAGPPTPPLRILLGGLVQAVLAQNCAIVHETTTPYLNFTTVPTTNPLYDFV
jgi:hypothetical protein